jgi:catechol 2,3-dioxygenase-like lactoylglutathione lyase family enzyme
MWAYTIHMLKMRAISIVAFALFWAAALSGQTAGQTQRPKILGVAHIALKTDDLAAARNFYGRDLGFQEAVTFDKESGVTYFKVNDRQYIEVTPELKDPAEDRLSNICFETDNVRKLRDYLADRGVKVPDRVKPGPDQNLTLTVKDPNGHDVEFTEYVPWRTQSGIQPSRDYGQNLSASRVSQHIIHVGFTVQDREAADKFYKDILGFHEMWHGGSTDERTDWVDMRVPDGTDWLEYMLNVQNPSPRRRGVMNHLALGVTSVKEAEATLKARGVDLHDQQAKIGRDGKWQLNLYDPNLTRVELMEFKPVQPPCCSPFK